MFRLDPNTSDLTSWLNSLQDEVCTPIEKTTTLSPSLDQLNTSIEATLAGECFTIGELSDYSGNPVSLADLAVKQGETVSFLLYIDASLKDPANGAMPVNVDLPSNLNPQPDTSSANFSKLASVLSSDDLLQSKMDGSGYEPLALPDVSGLSRAQVGQIVKQQNARKYLDRQTAIVPYTFGWSESGFTNRASPLPFRNYSMAQEFAKFVTPYLDPSRQDVWTQTIREMSLLYFAMQPLQPVFVAADGDGRLHVFFNRMLYGDALRVKLGVFNLGRIVL